METAIYKKTNYNPLKGWLFFLPFYLLLFGLAYHVSGTICMKSIEVDKYFGISFGKELIFNQLLFLQLCIAVAAIAIIHLISIFTGSYFTIGRLLLAVLLIAALLLFILGINVPLIKTTKFYFIKENYSLIDVLSNLKSKNEILLYWVMLTFTFIVPLMKMVAIAFEVFFYKSRNTKSRIISLLSKWAMVDVLVLAVLISCMKSGNGLVEMSSSNGLGYFTSSVVLSHLISTLLPHLKSNK